MTFQVSDLLNSVEMAQRGQKTKEYFKMNWIHSILKFGKFTNRYSVGSNYKMKVGQIIYLYSQDKLMKSPYLLKINSCNKMIKNIS